MVMIVCWKAGRRSTDARIKGSQIPLRPFAAESLSGSFPTDITLVAASKPRDFIRAGPYGFVSMKSRKIMTAFGAAAEFFPVEILYSQQKMEGWFYLNIALQMDCLDQERTVRVGPRDPQPELIRHMAIDESRCGDAPLFMIAGTPHVGVSDRMAHTILDNKCTGVAFISPEKWRNAALHYE